MATVKKCTWTGKSGTKYTYNIHGLDGDWNDVGGNYIFAKETSATHWAAVYIGQTGSFGDRLPNHEKRPCAIRNGATHVHAHTNGQAARQAEEADLLAAVATPCNEA